MPTPLDNDESPIAAPRRAGQCLQRRDLGFALQEQRSARWDDTRRRHHHLLADP